jgi:hypothetical protein
MQGAATLGINSQSVVPLQTVKLTEKFMKYIDLNVLYQKCTYAYDSNLFGNDFLIHVLFILVSNKP